MLVLASCGRRTGLTLLLLLMFVVVGADAQTYSILTNFTGHNGAEPGALIMDASGSFYGIAQMGGPSVQCQGGCGVVYRLERSGSAWVVLPLYMFNGCSDGAVPSGLVFGADGSLYGTTQVGGSACAWAGNGTVFKLTPPLTQCKAVPCYWKETVLYTFQGGSDGVYPSGLLTDSANKLFGVTLTGGNNNNGTVYELSRTGSVWTKTDLHTFTGGADGGSPSYRLLKDDTGNLYGTTLFGSSGGVAYQLSPNGGTWTETVLHNFTGGRDGVRPIGLVLAGSGDLYGSTEEGGLGGGGIVFKLHPAAGIWNESVLFSFPVPSEPAGLALDASGTIFGVTGSGGFGSVFQLTNENGTWVKTTLHDFTFLDGAYPDSPVVIDRNGNLVGATIWGGNNNQCGIDGCGVIWQIAP
jgi:uncharacterized repeat protein (TIGR03803 family)